MPAYDVVLKKVALLQVAEARGVAPTMAQVGLTINQLFDQVTKHIQQQGATWIGPGITVYYDQEVSEQNISVGAYANYSGMLTDGEQVKISTLPSVETMASVIHHGSFSTMHQAYHAILKWIEANGYHITSPNRELYLEYEHGGDQSKFVTEIQFPVETNPT